MWLEGRGRQPRNKAVGEPEGLCFTAQRNTQRGWRPGQPCISRGSQRHPQTPWRRRLPQQSKAWAYDLGATSWHPKAAKARPTGQRQEPAGVWAVLTAARLSCLTPGGSECFVSHALCRICASAQPCYSSPDQAGSTGICLEAQTPSGESPPKLPAWLWPHSQHLPQPAARGASHQRAALPARSHSRSHRRDWTEGL